MRLANLGSNYAYDWVPENPPNIKIAKSDFDTVTQTLWKAEFGTDKISGIYIGKEHPDYGNMFITDFDLSLKSGIWKAQVTWTGIFPNLFPEIGSGSFTWVIDFKTVQRLLYKPVQVSVRSYSDSVQKSLEDTVYTVSTPRLTATEEYLTDIQPSNDEIGKQGGPLSSPSTTALIEQDYPLAFVKKAQEPNGWILNTRNWIQVLDKDIYKITDEWIYQIPEELEVVE